MSSPLSGSAGDTPAPGFYPDPSIPGYIRYWNGSAWVPGTSRPEPQAGDSLPSPPSAAAASTAISEGPPPSRAEPAPMEETGPVFLDEDADGGGEVQLPAAREGGWLPEVRPRGEVATTGIADWNDPSRLHGQRPEPASAWQADASRQGGFAGQPDERVSWGSAEGDEGRGADPRGGWGGRTDEGQPGGPAGAPESAPPEGTFLMRVANPESLRSAAAQEAAEPGRGGAQRPEHTVGLRRPDLPGRSAEPRDRRQPPAPTPPVVPGQGSPVQQQPSPSQEQAQQPTQHQVQPESPPVAQAPAAAQQGVPPVSEGPQPSWAQQVHDLAGQPGGGPEAVTPWRPPTADPFLQAASQQEARPASLGKRFAARLVDGALTSAVAFGVAFPFAGPAVDHITAKMDAVRQSGATETVWLIDGTTGGYLVIVLGALLLFGLVYEVLPTRLWGRTLGKKMFGIKVLTMGQQDRPGFGGALLRWLAYGVLALLGIGVLNVLWCFFDRPWRQCWHDKLARTFVSKDSGELRL